MEEDKTKNADSESKNIEDVLRERGRIDEMIQKKFRKRMAILFSDICGFTHFTEEKGDIASRAWVQQHHDIVLPIIKSHGGRVITIMGDGILSSFPDSLSAVQGSISIQKALAQYNKEKDPDNEIHVSMGINSGEVLLDGDNVAGDVVNVASRIETKAEKDQILISKSAYNEVEGSEDILCRAHGSVSVKGKSKPLELYRVIWQDEDIVLNIGPQVRALSSKDEPEIKAPLKTLQVDITREEDRLKISVSEQNAGEVSTVRHYEELPVSMELIGKRCNEIIKTLNNANRGGRLSKDILLKLREVGQVFRDELFTITVKNKIKDAKAEHLILNLDDQLVHVPWELLHDGKQFLCQRFNMGRLVRTRQAFLSYKSRVLARPLKMLLLADPGGDLKGAYEEGKQIRDFMDRDKSIINATLRSEGIGIDFIKEKIRNFDIVHFAGHAEFNADNPGEGGWRLTDGILKAKDISKMAGTGAMPALIFSNACQSARTEEWRIKENFQDEIFGLANAFILAGVKHYMGTFWEILDEPSRLFAMEFYKNLLSGMTIGSATRRSRLELIDKYGEETIVWASYLLYGDPTFNYMDQLREMNHEEKKPERLIAPEKASLEVRAGEEKLDFGKKAGEKSGKGWYWVLGIILMAVLLTGYFIFFSKDTSDIEQTLLSSYHTGDYSKARETGSLLMEKNPDLRLSYVILGNIHLIEGDLRTAESFYQKGISAAKGTNDQKAEALMGLGRIASIEGNSNEAMEYYRKSAELAPGMGRAYASQAMLLDRLGEYEQAMDMFNRAEEASLIEPGYTAVARETGKKAALKNDREKQEQIDALVKDLLENMKEPKSLVPEDGWTSMPLTMWIMEPETIGYSLQEGKEQIIGSCVLDNLINNSRVSIVERGILDKLLEELKLGTSRLADQSTALSLGRIMAARMILTGKVHYSGEVTQITFRLIETETGQVKAAINEEFNSDMPASEIAEKLTDILAEKIHALYPLRGIVSGMNDKLIAINIGQNQGVRQGQRFRVKDTDLVLEIDQVQPETCSAKQIEGSVPINEGLLVEEEGRSE